MNPLEFHDFIMLLFEGYQRRKKEHRLYEPESIIPAIIIQSYYDSNPNPLFDRLYYNYKRRYLYNENRIDEKTTTEEMRGLLKVYNYICDYDFESQKLNIFVEALRIHQLLYSECLDPSFGGKLRESEAILHNSSVEIPSPLEAKKRFQSYITYQEEEYDRVQEYGIFDYIDQCIRITTDLIHCQPFADGNKRTFRALMNLMFKKHNLPPVYIKTTERTEYKDALMRAMKEQNYATLNLFYYYKICDSIYDLDIFPQLQSDPSFASGPGEKKKIR